MNDSKDFESSLEKVRIALNGYIGESKTGAIIHRIITDAAPEIDIRSVVEMPTGTGALTKFIETYLSSILTRIGNQGGDTLYAIGDVGVSQSKSEDPNVWKAFVSPNAVHNLYLRMSDMRLFATKSLSEDSDVHQIARVTEDEHTAIRQGFFQTLPDAQRGLLDEESSSALPYSEFTQLLRQCGLVGIWSKYRRNAFKLLLEDRLEQIPLSEDLVPAVAAQLITSQNAGFKQEEKKSLLETAPLNKGASSTVISQTKLDWENVRSLAQSIIGQMSHDEIRAMRLPFGAVLDALNASK